MSLRSSDVLDYEILTSWGLVLGYGVLRYALGGTCKNYERGAYDIRNILLKAFAHTSTECLDFDFPHSYDIHLVPQFDSRNISMRSFRQEHRKINACVLKIAA